MPEDLQNHEIIEWKEKAKDFERKKKKMIGLARNLQGEAYLIPNSDRKYTVIE